MEPLSQKLSGEERFSKDPETRGFDNSSGDRWIYPENYPVRDYQFSIVQSALYHNTLVCLPTGLGKTFIAAVVMYNFWRWYPMAKIVFLAPTKPLVAQQIKACNTIMGIESQETVELTGQMDQKKRQAAWSSTSRARVVFATPQVFHNDLEKNIVPTDLVKCVVIDEAHKALGKHSYCESIRLLNERSKYFRVLGLSATPGSKLDAVQKVIRNLYISRLELRDDASPDVTPYVNERKLEIVIVGLGNELEKFKERYIAIMDPHIRVLVDNRVLPRVNTGNLSKGRMYYLSKEWQEKPNKSNNHGSVSKTLMILVTMYHAYELMIRHGLRAFYNFYQKHDNKFWLSNEHALAQLLEEIGHFLGPFPEVPSENDDTFPPISENVQFGHNKFYKLQDLLLQHFETYENRKEDTRAIVFVEYRDIANELYVLLLRSTPLLRPRKLVGQAGLKRKDQKRALDDFRSNRVNVLISTSVGEEGLDVGEVDLIVCFDISQTDPIRLVQRMGRTGRKRAGRVIVLVTDGKEHQTLKSSLARRDSMNNKVLNSSGITSALYKNSPRMVPKEFNPECRKTSVIAPPKNEDRVSTKKRKGNGARDPRKRPADTADKPATSKNSAPAGSQSLMKYFSRPRGDVEAAATTAAADDFDKVPTRIDSDRSRGARRIESPRRDTATVKSSNVKLLTSDEAAVEFLTLCTMKRSQEVRDTLKTRTNPYLPAYYERSEETNFRFELPDLEILERLLDDSHPWVEEAAAAAAAADLNDRDSVGYLEDWDFRSSQRFRDNERVDLAERTINEFSDSRFEELLDYSSHDSERENRWSERRANERSEEDYPNEERVDWAESATGFEFRDSRTAAEAKTRTNDDDKLDEREASIPDPTVDIKYGLFEELLNEDSETSSERENCDPESDRVYEKSAEGRFEDPANGESDDSDATIDGLERSSAFEDLPNQRSTTKSDIDGPDNDEERSAVVDAPSYRLAIRSLGNSTLEAPSDFRTNDECSIAKREKSGGGGGDDASFDTEFGKHASDGTRVESIASPGETSESSTRRRSHEAFQGTSPKKKSSSEERFVNKEYSRPAAASSSVDNEPECSRDSPRANSREISAGSDNVPVESEKHQSDDDIFASDDIFVDPNFEEEIIKIERSVEEISRKDGHTFASSGPKTIPSPPLIEPTTNQDRAAVVASLRLDWNLSAGESRVLIDDSCDFVRAKSRSDDKPDSTGDESLGEPKLNESHAASRAKFFRFGLNLGAEKHNFFIRDRCESDRGDSNSRVVDRDEPSSANIKTRNPESTIPNPRVLAQDFHLDDCDWDSNDFQVPRVESATTTIGGRNASDLDNRRRIVARISTGGAAEPKSRLSLSKKLSRNICQSSWSVRTKESSSRLFEPDSESENDFVVTRLERSIPENIGREYFTEAAEAAAADSISAVKRAAEPTAMHKPVRSTRLPPRASTPLSVVRNDSAPSEYHRDRSVIARKDSTNEERTVSGPGRKFVSRDLDTRKRKRSRANATANKRARVRSDFLDDEAEVSTDVDGTSGSSGADDDLENFVSYTQNISDEVDMQAHYLQTVRSPRRLTGFFVRKLKSPQPSLRVYSQPVRDDEPNRYINDSFCVDEHEDAFQDSVTSDDLTRLERLESRLESRLKSKKRKRASSSDSSNGKRKRKVVPARDGTTSSEDETEALRRQILEESFALKKRYE